MDTNFGEWYRSAHLEPDDKLLKKRWKGIEGFSKDITGLVILDLARLLHAQNPKGLDFEKQFRSAFFRADSAFKMQGNDHELAVLAGATIAYILSRKNSLGNVAALATICPSFQGKAKTAKVPDIQDRARKYLVQRSASLRTSAGAMGKRISAPQIDELLKTISEACSTNALTNLANPLNDLLTKLGKALQRIVQSTNHLQRNQWLCCEELEMLWWMQGKHSRDLEVPLDQIDLTAASIVAGKELADLTKVLPGPFASRAILHQILLREDSDINNEVVLSSAISALDQEWRQKWIQGLRDSETIDLCPVSFTVKKSLETNNARDLSAAFKKVTALSANVKIEPVGLAVQVYEESLFVKAFNSIGEM